MTDPFSLPTGSFAVVSVVEVLLETSVECCCFLNALKDAHEEIDRLCTSIEEYQALVEALKANSTEVQGHKMPPAQGTLHKALELFDSSVRLLHRQLSALRTLKTWHKSKWKTYNAFKFYLDDRKMSRCSKNLENAESARGTALGLVEGQVN
ncbi:uncharacterized protein CC84DRAFT_1180282 [Paraphaeosphaeria sporulosa]|uniref:Fungal N-terminal domain-containing protein n=1 Tax=Paraphaeosphaeria sporulosa TaxID=1460663 RepID=A0A177C2W2_9PLEO|nr:uncharacterized protein CC84DRAFT_1180282 [Paraphaeosphaeria sporulosa]OAG01239.1 hypothetical protein CC84DRAFT_1180282 [Paraphaeosphaeria sporulosa]